jgi:hypothetical protein
MGPNPSKKLADALKYEGDTMGHCVGGYAPDVIEGRSRIFSLRDAKNEPHVTVETRPHTHQSKYESDWFTSQPEELQNQITQKALAEHGAAKNERTPAEDRFTWGKALSKAIREHLGDVSEEIIQIKGKGNAKPKKDYIPFVQDFVKSGNWSDVGDIKNADMIKHKGQYLTHAEHDDWMLNELKPQQKAAGGAVQPSIPEMKLALSKQGMYSPLEKAAMAVPRTKGTPAEFMAEGLPQYKKGGFVQPLLPNFEE